VALEAKDPVLWALELSKAEQVKFVTAMKKMFDSLMPCVLPVKVTCHIPFTLV